MADDREDPVQEAATEELRDARLAEDPTERVAAELTRIRFEMTAIRKILQGRESIEGEELKILQGRESIEGGEF